MGSHFKERLCAPGAAPPLGMFVKLPTIETIEILASAGFDFVIIDMEHAPLGVDVVYRMLATAELAGLSALVRLRGHDSATANMFLDAGASGILIPHCSPYEKAKELITDMLFPPNGRRGAGGSGRATRWGIDGPTEYRRGGESGILRVPMIEDPEAVDDIERILDIPGVDAVFIGQGDLTQTLGNRAQAQVLVDRALDACKTRGVPACTTAYGDDVASRLQQGFKWLAIGADTALFSRAVQQRLATARS